LSSHHRYGLPVPGMDCKWIFLSLPTSWSSQHYYSFSQPVSGNGTAGPCRYTVSLSPFFITLLTVTDLELFKAWGFRIDATSLHYLETPVEAFASMGAAPVFPLLLLLAALFFLVYRVLKTIVQRTTGSFTKLSYGLTVPVFLVLTGSLIIPIRGGLQLAPMNESAVFFSDKSFANYAAVNVPWNYMSSLLNASYSKKNPFYLLQSGTSQPNGGIALQANGCNRTDHRHDRKSKCGRNYLGEFHCQGCSRVRWRKKCDSAI
jgi:hypothetical protein